MESMPKDSDFDLVRECQSAEEGDAAVEAFERIFERYRDRVFNLAIRLLGNASDAEDVSQEAFVTVYRKVGDFRFSSRFYTWLYRIVYNLCVDHKRRHAGGESEMTNREDGQAALGQLPDPEAGPLELLAEGEFRQKAVERALQRLSSPLRMVIILRYMEGKQYSEIAEVLECSVGTVKSRLSRAHSFLQEVLGGV